MPFARKLTVSQVEDIRRFYSRPVYERGMSTRAKARELGISYETLRQCGIGVTYKWVGHRTAARRWIGTPYDHPIS